ncbi:MAG: SOS response-associated peptidase [Chitinophagaceae bacterium]|nr:SOS response-associated peptidase [Chitinophagaceae bacterium]
MCFNIEHIIQHSDTLAIRYNNVLPALSSEKKELRIEFPTYYFVSGFSHPSLPIITKNGIELAEWGLIPHWIKDEQSANNIKTKTLNAVGETISEKPSFKKAILKQRCLLPVNGFYEWRDYKKTKYPYLIQVKDKSIFSLGCIYDVWVDQSTGEVIKTFSIITTPANPLMEKIHNLKKRMPLIIKAEDEAKWIDENLSTIEVQQLIKPFDESEMTAYTISRDANNSRNDRNIEQIIHPILYSELPN